VPEAAIVASAEDAGARLDQFLSTHLPALSRSQVQRLIREGHVRLDGGPAPKPSLPVTAGLIAHVTIPAPAPAAPRPEPLPLTICYDDEELVVVDKPAGLVVHPGAGHSSGTLVNALLHHVSGLSGIGGTERPGIVHRLDRGTSGLMVIAKHDRAHRELARQFHDREVSKAYRALVWGRPRAGMELDKPIGRDRRHRQRMSSRTSNPRAALTRVAEVEPLGSVSLVTATIATGRTHQIRVHLSEAGHPVVGDALYGGVHKTRPARLAVLDTLERPFLHASWLAFAHPADGRAMTFESPLPEDLATVVAALREGQRAEGKGHR
jgi:23S rRNA pseudouridine1911/1915/1917 synthase